MVPGALALVDLDDGRGEGLAPRAQEAEEVGVLVLREQDGGVALLTLLCHFEI